MDICGGDAVNDNETTDIHVFTDSEDHILELSFNCFKISVITESLEFFNGSGLVCNDNLEDILYECLEGFVQRSLFQR